MILFSLNGRKEKYSGDKETSLMTFLREERGITSVKDGCSGQAACGACLVELGGKPALACSTPMARVDGKEVITIEGFPDRVRRILARAFVSQGAVQCGYCTPGMLARAKNLIASSPNPSRADVVKAIDPHICRCTGVCEDHRRHPAGRPGPAGKPGDRLGRADRHRVSYPKHDAYEKALGASPYVNDMKLEGMVYGALKFSEHPRAKVVGIDVSPAERLPGVMRVFTARDIPGRRYQGLLVKDWPMMVAQSSRLAPSPGPQRSTRLSTGPVNIPVFTAA